MALSSSTRLSYLDWLRGIAAIVMLQGHTFDSFTRPDLRDSSAFVLSQFVGGLPPALFLFLTGVTLAFRMDSDERRGLNASARVVHAWKRAGYLLGLAFLFRIQLWAFAWPDGRWTDIFKVDILNCMAVSVFVISLMASFRTAERMRLCAVLGLAIACASPLMSQVNWSGVAPIVKDYLAPDYTHFSFFPWASFLAFGASAGSMIRQLSDESLDRAMQWGAISGAMLIVSGRYFADIPYSLYSKSEFWLDSPAQVFIKLGVMLCMMAFAFLWTRYVAAPGWSWIRQFGTTSLLVYWLHTELVYGRWLKPWKENLDVPQTLAAAAGVIVLMLVVSTSKTYVERWSARPAALRWYPFPSPRVPAD
ncbi:MAG: heparan-alpha-glucosaminide N-acetyltransferase domain-containing protein [Bryobacteraceae bacterium]